ncbi:hypothetical protein FRB99_006081 [Tulasnella sp. 403]|nr:hypothetical protein FRB99_006081 [Tulasnella sp. 403]
MPPKQNAKQGSSSKVKEDKVRHAFRFQSSRKADVLTVVHATDVWPEEPTIGQKNKSSKVQKQVAIMQEQASRSGKNKAQLEREREKEIRAREKAEEEKRKAQEAAMLRPVLPPQKVPPGVDPKSIVCQYFKIGTCDKGKKCKFAHDLEVERKAQKRDIYTDERDEKLDDTMDKWDEAKLRQVVLSKAGNPRTTTDIVCKYFIDAIETQKFGWFCKSCIYRHALPPGFVLKSQKKAAEEAEKANTISLEEFLEVERHKLGSNLTAVTPETFAKWKQTRMDKKDAEAQAVQKAKETQQAAGKYTGMSGRDLVRMMLTNVIWGTMWARHPTFLPVVPRDEERRLLSCPFFPRIDDEYAKRCTPVSWTQFTFNPDWFDDEDVEEDWDFSAYRKEKEEEDRLEEQRLIEQFNEGFTDASGEPSTSGGRGDEEDAASSDSPGPST